MTAPLDIDCGLPIDEVVRLNQRPGLHGVHCTLCDRLFDGVDAPLRLDEAVMRMKTAVCPSCGKRRHLHLLMPWRYRAVLVQRVRREQAAEAVRQVADRYIARDGGTP